MIQIKEVLKKQDLKKFIRFPVKLYKNNPYYVPAMELDEWDAFNPKKNPAYDFCETKLFLALENNTVVGRVAALINHAYNRKVDKKLIRFTRFDVIDNIEVSRKLLEAVMDFGASKGMVAIMGPIGFTDIDKQGMLIEGFDEMDLSITLYNHAYYKTHLEALGFQKDADWVEYQISVPKEMDPRIKRISDLVKKRYGFHRMDVPNRKALVPIAREALAVVNEAFAKLYGVVPLTERVIEKTIKDYVPVVNLDYVIVIADKTEKVVGFGLMVPSIAQALKKSNGRLFPFGLFRMLKALNTHDILEMFFIAVKPEYQNLGVNALILAEGIEIGIRNGVRFAESGPELELNNPVQDQWKGFEFRQHRRRRSWVKTIE